MKDGFQGFTDYVTTNAVPEIVDNYKKNIFRFGLAAGIVRPIILYLNLHLRQGSF